MNMVKELGFGHIAIKVLRKDCVWFLAGSWWRTHGGLARMAGAKRSAWGPTGNQQQIVTPLWGQAPPSPSKRSTRPPLTHNEPTRRKGDLTMTHAPSPRIVARLSDVESVLTLAEGSGNRRRDNVLCLLLRCFTVSFAMQNQRSEKDKELPQTCFCSLRLCPALETHPLSRCLATSAWMLSVCVYVRQRACFFG